MSDRVEKAAREIYDAIHRDTDPYSVPKERAAEKIARALDAAGMLAPAPGSYSWTDDHGTEHTARVYGSEWACRYTRRSGEVMYRGEGSEVDARSWATDEGDQIVRRYVTSWEVVE